MFKKFVTPVIACGMMLGYSSAAYAEEDYGTPVVTFHTTIYDTYAESNDFSLVIGASEAGVGQYIGYDCGTGYQEVPMEAATVDSDGNTSGTVIQCRVNSDGIVKLYCDDPSYIDWFNADGCYIDRIEFNGLNDLQVLSLSHNELKSLDLSSMNNLYALYVSDNTFEESPLVIGPKPTLSILEINNIGALSPEFTLTDYPYLVSLDAWNAKGLTTIDGSQCPYLVKLSLDGTDVATIDVSKNPLLQVLNISDTRITELDLSQNPQLTQLYCTHESSVNEGYQIKSLDLTNNPELYYLFCTGNGLTELDLTKNTKLGSLTARKNKLTELDLSNNSALYCVNISGNCFGYSTLPEPNDNWGEYDYAQSNFPVEKSYPVGTLLDFRDKVLRTGTVTDAALYMIDESDPSNPVLVDGSLYSYENGVVTLKGVPTDSVYVEFTNTLFTAANLRSDKFKVKSVADYGKPSQMLSFTSAATTGASVSFGLGMQGATATEPKKFYVDFGNGTLTEMTTTSSKADDKNVKGVSTGSGMIKVYTDDGEDISALNIEGLTLYSVDLSQLRSLRSLRLVNTSLYSINMEWNRCLENLELTGNHFYTVDLAANNQDYGKNCLTDVNLSNNGMSEFGWNENYTVKNLNLSNNSLTSLSLGKNVVIEDLNVSNNNIDYLNIEDCAALTTLNVSNNVLTSLNMPDESVLTNLNISNNKFTLATIPSHDGIAEEDYIYAPQSNLVIPQKGPGIDLSAQNIDGKTVYTWYKEDGTQLTEDVDYSNTNGRMRFINTEAGNVYCTMSNSVYPAFTGENIYRTSLIEAADMPTNVIASFTTTVDGETPTLTITSLTPNNSIFVDWTGNDDLTQYLAETSYIAYSDITTHAGANVKVYSYDDVDNISVFSLRNASLSSFDASKMKQLICLNVTNGGLYEISMPESPNLQELTLQGNHFKDIDITQYPKLVYLNLAENEFTTLDLSVAPNLQQAYLSDNALTELTIADNKSLWSLFAAGNKLSSINFEGMPNMAQMDLSDNNFSDITLPKMSALRVFYVANSGLETIDLSKATALYQLNLAGNNLQTVDLAKLKNLVAVSIANNKFKFSTLPEILDQYRTFTYSPQQEVEVTPIDCKVDLSSEAEFPGEVTKVDADGNIVYDEEGNAETEEGMVQTVYTWLLGEPDYDEDENIVNETLESEEVNAADPEYRVVNGVTEFIYPQTNIVGMMVNSAFEDLVLFTNMFSTNGSGVADLLPEGNTSNGIRVEGHTVYVTAAAGTSVRLYTLNGAIYRKAVAVEGETSFENVESAVYIALIGDKAVKVIVK